MTTAPLVAIERLAGLLPGKARLMGIDLGTKTIGLAISDVERRLASPLETIRRVKFTPDAERLAALARRYEIAALVLGLPLNMDGTEGPRAQSVRSFARSLAPILPLPICLWDERLSTAAVTRAMIAQDVSRARRAEAVDKLAAAYILEGALARLAFLARAAPAAAPDEPPDTSRET